MFGGLWWVSELPNKQAKVTQWGLEGDIPRTGYFDSDRALDIAVVRKEGAGLTWYIKNATEVKALQWGLVGDVPFTGDLDGDGIDEIIVLRDGGWGPTGDVTGFYYWYPRKISGEALNPRLFGLSGDYPQRPYDWDSDGLANLIVTRPNIWPIRTYVGWDPYAEVHVDFGLTMDIPMIGSYTGYRLGELLVYRSVPGQVSQHFIRRSYRYQEMKSFGLYGDTVLLPDGRGVRDVSELSK